MKVAKLLGLRGPWQCQVQGHPPPGVMALSESFFKPLVADNQKASLASLSQELRPFRHLEGSLAWGPSLLFGVSGTQRGPLAGVLLGRLAHQTFKGAPWVGPYSVVQCVSHLTENPGWGPTL